MLARATLLGLQGCTAAARALLGARGLLARRRAPPPEEGPLRVLLLSQYPEHFAGTKYRLSIWADRLRAAGHAVDLSLAVRSPHAERLSNDWSVRARAEFHLRLLAARVPAALRGGRYDVAVIHMNDLPFWGYGAPFVARALARTAGRVLLDLDDLPAMSGESHLAPRARALGEAVDGLIVGTPDLAPHFPGRPTWIVPTCVDTAEWPVPDRSARTGAPLLGWVGTPGNLRHLEALAPVLAEVCERHGARVRVVSSRPPELPGVPVEFVRWSAENEVADLLDLDVGLAPLHDGPRERCKCGLKALQYMACGLPVIAAPVAALSRIVADGETGAHAADLDAWRAALDRLLADRELRLRFGAAGRRAAEQRWSFDANQPRFEAALRGLVPDGGDSA